MATVTTRGQSVICFMNRVFGAELNVVAYWNKRRRITEDSDLNFHRLENLKLQKHVKCLKRLLYMKSETLTSVMIRNTVL